MSEIRNLTRNGETFYPLTVVEAVSDPNGEYIGYYTENPEWIRAILDNDGRLLAGIKADGSIEWSLGVPKPIRDYVLENLDTIYQQLDEAKVDKVEGRSLIDEDIASRVHYEENPEFIKVELDANNRIIKAIKKDGTEYFSVGIDIANIASEYSIDNPEFLSVWVDNENKVLAGIKKDGSVEWSVGVPKPVKDYIQENLEQLSEAKVDKVEGKSLIDSGYASGISCINNPEFLEVKVDSDDRIIEATSKDGTKLFSLGLKSEYLDIDSTTLRTFNNPEFLSVWIDNEEKIIAAIKNDGDIFFGYGIPSQISELFGKYIENPEYIKVDIDSNDRIIEATSKEGTKILPNGLNVEGEVKINNNTLTSMDDLENRIDIHLDSEDRIVSYRESNGVLVENAGIETPSLNLVEDGIDEFMSAIKAAGYENGGDFSDRKVVELPDPKHYSMLNLIIKSLPVNDSDVSEGIAVYYDGSGNYFRKPITLEAQGQTSRIFSRTKGKGNYTINFEKEYFPLDEYEYKSDEKYYIKDETGNFIELSKGTPYSADMYEKTEPAMKFSSWVPQDSFHLKGCAKDVTRSILPTSYKWAWQFMNYLDAKPNRVLIDESGITTTYATGNRLNDWPNDARCLPDGFPVEVYINGKYWGLYSWQLKKHRKNYSMDKKDYTSFFLDADQMMSTDEKTGLWNEGPDGIRDEIGRTWWTGFDIKGPKDLIVMDGSEFDGDHPQELIGPKIEIRDYVNWVPASSFTKIEPLSGLWDTEITYSVGQECWCYDEELSGWTRFKAIKQNSGHIPLTFETNSVYDATNKKHKGSYTTKTLIRQLSIRYLEIKTIIENATASYPEWDMEHEYLVGDRVSYDSKRWLCVDEPYNYSPGSNEAWQEVIDTIGDAKTKFNEYFDYNACMLVYIYNCLMKNYDSIKKNTLWGMYGSGKIFPALWDLDGMYGTGWIGNSASAPSAYLWYVLDPNQKTYANSEWPLALFWSLYETEIKETYADLRTNGIINIETWHDIMFNHWVDRIGEEVYNRDIKKWPETPSYRKNYTNTEYWSEVGFLGTGIESKTEWSSQGSYNIGDIVVIRGHSLSAWYDQFRAVKPSDSQNPQCPVTKFYDGFPIIGGFYDSPKRMEKWMREQIRLCDIALGYNN